MSHGPRFSSSACRFAAPFLAGSLLSACVLLLGAAPQGGAQVQPRDSSFAGPPRVTESGSDYSFKGPPPSGTQGAVPPSGMGYNNPGGMVDAAALQAAAAGGIHYHVHYHGSPGPGGFVHPGYAPTSFVNPASVPAGGTASQYMPGYGPGNPGPLGSESGLDTNPAVGARAYTGFSGYGAYGNYFGGPGGYFGGGGGVFPSALAANAAYANAGFVGGFND